MGMQAGPGPICKRCHDDKWRLSERGWCDTCKASPLCGSCGHDWERHGPEAGGCVECQCSQVEHSKAKVRRVPLSSFSVGDLLDPEPLLPIVFDQPTRRSSLRGGPIPRRGHGASEGDPSL